VRSSKKIVEILGEKELDKLFDPQYYARHVDLIFKRVFEG